MEYIATIIMVILFFIAAQGLILQSILRFSDIVEFLNGEYAILIGSIIIVTAITKEFMAQYSMTINKLIKSVVLVADAWHHRTDAIASVAVGFSIIGSKLGFLTLYPLFGIIVSLIITYIAYKMLLKISNTLIGTAPDDKLLIENRQVVMQVEESRDIENIYVHDQWISNFDLSLTRF